MENGTEFGQRVFKFIPRNWGILSGVHIADFTVVSSELPSLWDINQHVGRHVSQNSLQLNFFMVYDKSLEGRVHVSIPLVCKELWQTVEVVFRQQHQITIHVCPLQFLAHKTMSRGGKVPLSLFELSPPLKGVASASLSHDKLSQICRSIITGKYSLSVDMKAKLWKNILGVFPPSLSTQKERQRYFESLCAAAKEMKQKWLVKFNESDPETLVLFNSIKRDARRTDPTLEFFAPPPGEVSPHGADNISRLCNIVMTYVEEHKHQAYTQGMTDLVAPILYVVSEAKHQKGHPITNVEYEAYVMYCAMMKKIGENFTPNCQGAMERVECLRHLCQVFDSQLYLKLNSLEDDAFSLCFGTVLIDCKREFPFMDSLEVMEVIWSSRFPSEPQSSSLVDWADFLTTESKNLLHHAIRGEVPLSVGRTSSASHVPNHPPDDRCYQERPAVGYAITPLPSSSEGVVQSLLESGRVTPYRPFDPEQNVSTASVDIEGVDHEEDPLESSIHSSYQRIDPGQAVTVPLKTSFSVFVCLAILMSLREQMLRDEADFVGISLILKLHRDRHDLKVDHVLHLACDLYQQYRHYQKLLSLPSTQWIHKANLIG